MEHNRVSEIGCFHPLVWRDNNGKDWEETNISFVTTVEPGAVTPEALAALVRDTFEQVCVMLTVEEVNTKFI